MEIKIEGIYYIKDALKYGTFSAAAEHNYMTQANFSKEIAKLENTLGVKLLERNTKGKGITPTHTYRKIEKKFDDMLTILDEIKVICREDACQHTEYKYSAIGVNHAINDKLFRLMIEYIGYCNEEKQLDFSVKKLDNGGLIDLLLQKKLDYAVLIDWDGSIKSTDVANILSLELLFEDSLVVCVGKKSPYWDRQNLTIDEFLHIPQLTFTENYKEQEVAFYNLIGGVPLKLRYINDLNTALNIVCDSSNCLLTLESFISEHKYFLSNEIKGLRVGECFKKVPVYIAYRKDRLKSENERKLISNLKQMDRSQLT